MKIAFKQKQDFKE